MKAIFGRNLLEKHKLDDYGVWFELNDEPFMSDVFDTRPIRLKPRTITINGIEYIEKDAIQLIRNHFK